MIHHHIKPFETLRGNSRDDSDARLSGTRMHYRLPLDRGLRFNCTCNLSMASGQFRGLLHRQGYLSRRGVTGDNFDRVASFSAPGWDCLHTPVIVSLSLSAATWLHWIRAFLYAYG